MINGLNNDSASLVLDAAMKVNSGFKKAGMRCHALKSYLKYLVLVYGIQRTVVVKDNHFKSC